MLLCEKYIPNYMNAFEIAVNLGLKLTNIYKLRLFHLVARRKILEPRK